VLDGLQAIGGTFRAHEALGMATLGLAQGGNATKEIVVFTDAQRAGWRYDDPGAWKSLAAAWAKLPSRPKLLVRSFGAPAPFHNACLADLQTSRAVVGTDREVTLRATISNTGTSALTPGVVTLEIDGQEMKNQSVGLLAPGQSQAVEFSHRFTRPGPQVVVLRIAPQDDLASDDRVERVVAVRGKLPVLLVDGNPAGSFFERAAGYPALALAPSAALIAGKPPGEGFLMDPRVVAAPALAEADLESAAVIVLADVARLPARLAGKLADRVAGGAGLLVLAGPRTQPDFYNGWQGADGPLCPAPLSGETADPEGVAPAAATFRHESLKSFGDQSDLTSATLRRWWTSAEPVAGAVQAAAFGNGDAFLVSRPYGRGRVLLATCAFDARSGNLPARQSFVPLMHELVTWAAGGGIELNVSAAWSPSIRLGSSSGEPAGESPETLQATDPAGAPREAVVRKGRELAVSGPAVPGVYQIQNHASLAAAIDGLGTGKLPFVVTREAAESGFEPLGEADMELMRRHADVLLPGSVADLLAVLEGRGFGREIWKLLAGAAMVLFLLESVLARWVAKSRGTAEDSHVEFGETALWRGGQR
jgi:hypothetical protein